MTEPLQKPIARQRKALMLRAYARLLVLAAVIVGAACQGTLRSPSSDAAAGQAMMDMADVLNQLRDQSAGLQEQVDSLRDVVFRQDTLLRQLALQAGVPYKP